jgi:hypothetical protein
MFTANGSASPTEERQALRASSFRLCSDPLRNQQAYMARNQKQKPPTPEHLLLCINSLHLCQMLTSTREVPFRNWSKLEI